MWCLGLASVFVLGAPIMKELIWLGLAPIAIGATLQIGSRRVIYYRLFDAIGALAVATASGFALWILLGGTDSTARYLFSAFSIIFAFGCTAFAAYRSRHDFIVAREMPHGPAGTLDMHTGRVNPQVSPAFTERRLTDAAAKNRRVNHYLPLIAGLAFLAAQVLSADGIRVFLGLSVAFFYLMGSWGFGAALAHVLAIRAWEKRCGIKIIVDRR